MTSIASGAAGSNDGAPQLTGAGRVAVLDGRAVHLPPAWKATNAGIEPLNVDCMPNCYYAGAIDGDWLTTARTSVQVDIAIPADRMDPIGGYFVGLSIIDNKEGYDQIGFYGALGTWEALWSTSTSVCSGPSYTGDTPIELSPGSTYTFAMSLGGGKLTYTITRGGYLTWSKSITTTATYFFEVGTYWCGNLSNWMSYTMYEEVYAVMSSQNAPPWSFIFSNNKVDGAPFSAWSVLKKSTGATIPIQVQPLLNGAGVIIANEDFGLSTNVQLISTRPGSQVQFSGTVSLLYTLAGYPPPYTATLSAPIVPAGWKVTLKPTSGDAPFGFTATVNVPSSATQADYRIQLQASDTKAGWWTTVSVTVSVFIYSGCVAFGTPILTAGGYVPVQALTPGATIMGYDLATGTLVPVELLFSNRTLSRDVIRINGGDLELTSTDQPIYVKHGTFVGWLRDPQDLAVGDLLFDPVHSTWIEVRSVTALPQRVQVFDLVTTGPHDFIANGFLLLDKPHK